MDSALQPIPRQEPRRILKLDETVVNKIAAGEIIVRPSNAVKEMVENCLDAGATEISIIVKNGGLGMVQIQDNGCGIKKEDLPILCERFTTSKIDKFEDLSSLRSFGFRGEALSSISYIAKVKVISRTADSVCGFQMEYGLGKPLGQAKPSAANIGTIITVEDFFYNNPTRRAVLSNPSEEYAKLQEVLTKYAMQYPGVGFNLKKHGEHVADIRTPTNSSTLENAKILFGNSVASELLAVECENAKFQFKMTGFVSNANFSIKKYTFLLFINRRSVDCPKLRKSIELLYAAHLPKHSFPFVYLSLDLPPMLVDVNIHPTKAEVHFRFEEDIVGCIYEAVQSRIFACQESRNFKVQSTLVLPQTSSNEELPACSSLSQASTIVPGKLDPRRTIRTDSRSQTLDAFCRPPSSLQVETQDDLGSEISCTSALTTKHRPISVNLRSILQLRQAVEEGVDVELRRLIFEHKFVGCASENFALIQHQTKLYSVNVRKLSEELFYQIMLYDFQNFGLLKLSEPLPLQGLIDLAMEYSDEPIESPDERAKIASDAVNILKNKGKMMADYFSLQLSTDGCLVSLPMLLAEYVPPLAEMPVYVGRLAAEVNWEAEKECFDNFARVTAQFYSFRRDFYAEGDNTETDSWKWNMEHGLFPALRAMLLPPKSMRSDKTFLLVADLPDLYKVFERC